MNEGLEVYFNPNGKEIMEDEVLIDKLYIWNYTLKDPVIPGDILKVRTKKGEDFMHVRGIAYATGKEFCKEHRNVVKHTGEHFV